MQVHWINGTRGLVALYTRDSVVVPMFPHITVYFVAVFHEVSLQYTRWMIIVTSCSPYTGLTSVKRILINHYRLLHFALSLCTFYYTSPQVYDYSIGCLGVSGSNCACDAHTSFTRTCLTQGWLRPSTQATGRPQPTQPSTAHVHVS